MTNEQTNPGRARHIRRTDDGPTSVDAHAETRVARTHDDEMEDECTAEAACILFLLGDEQSMSDY